MADGFRCLFIIHRPRNSIIQLVGLNSHFVDMLVKANKITSCYIGPQISPELFVAEHFFLFLIEGAINGYDAHRQYTMSAGESCIIRKNQLTRYYKTKDNEEFGKIVVVFDEIFVRDFQIKHMVNVTPRYTRGAFVKVIKSELCRDFLAAK